SGIDRLGRAQRLVEPGPIDDVEPLPILALDQPPADKAGEPFHLALECVGYGADLGIAYAGLSLELHNLDDARHCSIFHFGDLLKLICRPATRSTCSYGTYSG
ncbi:MAG: hypothetical protein AVDCRST_MAG26-2003, partial [uncultured Chloroflexia bacterium]